MMLIEKLRGQFSGEDNTGFNPFDLIHKFGSPLTALLYSELFWPEFVEVEGMVFLASNVEDDDDRDRIMTALAQFNGDKRKVEDSFNFVDVPSLFGRRAEESSDEEDRLIAERLAAMWRAQLAERFPEKAFAVSAVDSGDEVGVRFVQVA